MSGNYSDSDENPARKNRKQGETTPISTLPDLEVIIPSTSLTTIASSPPTSKEPNKMEKIVDISPTTHIVPLLSKDGKKYIQISPIKSLPKDKVKNLIKLPNSPLPGLNLNTLLKFEVGSKALQALRTVKTATKSSKTSVPTITIVEEKNIPSYTKQVTDSKAGTDITIKPVKNILYNKGIIPAILRKRAKLDALKNTPSTNEENESALQLPQNQTVTKIVNKSTTNLTTIQKPQKNPNVLNKEDKDTLTKKESEKQQTERKNAVRKDRSPKKKKDKEKNTKSWRNAKSMYIADGFREDVENLIEKCLQGNKLNYERFCDVWKEMDFPCIFHGRHSSAELAELSEEVIHIAKAYMLSNEDNFEENVAGLFLVYALLNHQPFTGFAALRLVPRDVPIILGLEAEAKRQKRYDVLYVLGNVLIKGPCQFHVLEREVSMEKAIKKYFDGSVQSSKVIDNVCTKNSKCVSLFKKLISLDETYAVAQKQLEKYREEDKSSILSKRIAAELYKMYEAHIPRNNSDDTSTNVAKEIMAPSEPEHNRANMIKSIKSRAMGNTVHTIRHLTGVEERQVELSSEEESESEVEEQNKSTKRKSKFLGRSNSSALALQKFFSEKESNNDIICVSEPSQKEMPILDPDEPPSKQTRKGKRVNKNVPKEPQHSQPNDSANINLEKPKEQYIQNKKRKDLLDSSTPGLGKIKVYKLLPPFRTIGRKRKVSAKFASDVKKKQKSNKNEKKNDNERTDNDMPPIAIEVNKVNKHIEVESSIDRKAVLPKTEKKSNSPKRKKAAFSEELSNNNTVSETDTKSEYSKKAKQALTRTSSNNRNKKQVLEKRGTKESALTQKLTNTILKVSDDNRRSRRIPKIEKADPKPNTNGKNTNLPKRVKRNNESSNPILGLDKCSNIPEKPKSPTKSRAKLNTDKSPKIASNAKQIGLPTRVSMRIKNEREIKCEDDMETIPPKRRRMQNEG